MPTELEKMAHIGAALAVSNLGLFNYIEDRVLLNPDNWSEDPYSDVCQLAGHLMESDEHEVLFGEEADHWFEEVKKIGLEKAAETYHWHPWIRTIIEM